MNRYAVMASGAAAVLAVAWSWHQPLGAGDRLARQIEARARAQLDRDEMLSVSARLERHPLSRRLILAGPADEFQRGEIRRRMEAMPGVGEAVWDPGSLETEPVP